MTQKERANAFLKELTELTFKHEITITSDTEDLMIDVYDEDEDAEDTLVSVSRSPFTGEYTCII